MKAWITKDGVLTVKAESPTDAFALQQWANHNIGVALIDADIITGEKAVPDNPNQTPPPPIDTEKEKAAINKRPRVTEAMRDAAIRKAIACGLLPKGAYNRHGNLAGDALRYYGGGES